MKNQLETIDSKDLNKATGGAGDRDQGGALGGLGGLGGIGGTVGVPPKRPRPPGSPNPNCTVCGMG